MSDLAEKIREAVYKVHPGAYSDAEVVEIIARHTDPLEDQVVSQFNRIVKLEAAARFRNMYHDGDCKCLRTNDSGDVRDCTCGHEALRAELEDSDE